MKKIKAMAFIAAFLFSLSASVSLFAKCQYSSDWKKDGKKIVVCTKGDSFSDRKNAQKICEKVKGGSCRQPSTFSGSCSSSDLCYDGSGNKHSYLSGY